MGVVLRAMQVVRPERLFNAEWLSRDDRRLFGCEVSEKKKRERAERLAKANALIALIATTGRRFLSSLNGPHYFVVYIDGGGYAMGLWFVDSGTKTRMRPKRRHGESEMHMPHSFAEGGTMNALCVSMYRYISEGISLHPLTFGPWPDWVCGGDLWGYGDAMEPIRELARELRVVTT